MYIDAFPVMLLDTLWLMYKDIFPVMLFDTLWLMYKDIFPLLLLDTLWLMHIDIFPVLLFDTLWLMYIVTYIYCSWILFGKCTYSRHLPLATLGYSLANAHTVDTCPFLVLDTLWLMYIDIFPVLLFDTLWLMYIHTYLYCSWILFG